MAKGTFSYDRGGHGQRTKGTASSGEGKASPKYVTGEGKGGASRPKPTAQPTSKGSGRGKG